jgi:acyl-CoA thioesterase
MGPFSSAIHSFIYFTRTWRSDMTSFATLINSSRQPSGSLVFDVPDDWLQGRTAYGGFTAAVAYNAAKSAEEALPPLRSAQIAFIGPVSSDVQVRASLLRRGKSSAFVQARVTSNGELSMLGTFLFMADRPSAVTLHAPQAPSVPAPDDAEPALRGKGPAYRSQFEFRHGASTQDRSKPELLRWARLREREGIDAVTELLLIGDALPAGILPLFDVPPIISSANWTVHVHSDMAGDIATHDGWWLVHNKGESAANGISNQLMSVWNRHGVAAVSGSQTVSYFPAIK